MSQISDDLHLRKLQALGLLTGGVAHDFNNILSIIEGYAYILEHHFGSDAFAHDKLAAIFVATRRGTELTGSLLEYGQKADPSQPITNRCELTALLEKNKPLIRSLLSSRIELTLHLPSSLVMVNCSKDQVIESIIHMTAKMRDTIKHTGHITIQLHVTPEEAILALTNNVTGFSVQETFSHILDFSLQDKTVLIVDDEESLLPVLEHHLTNMGLKVLKAANADTALLLQKDYPDVIDFLLTDIVMPDVDGVQLAELITDNRPRMGVVYMTGHASRKNGIEIPGNSLIVPKPLNPETLSEALKKALEHVQDA